MKKAGLKLKTISIIIPVFNEEKLVTETLAEVAKSNTLKLKKEIIVIDDGSSDKTAKVVKEFISKKKYPGVKMVLLKNKINSGKGATVKRGFLEATGDLVLVQDADLEYSPSDYPTLLGPFFESNAEVVYGSRFVTNRPHRVLYYTHYAANKILTMFSNILTNLNFTDMETGYKVFKNEIVQTIAPQLESQRFGIEAELTARIAKLKGIKIFEVGVSYTGRSYEEGKKIGLKDGIKNVFEIARYNLLPNIPPQIRDIFEKFQSFLNDSWSEVKSELLLFPKVRFAKYTFIFIVALGIIFRTAGLTWGINTDGIKHGSPYHDEGHTYNIVFDPNFNKNFGEYEISKPVYFYRYIAENAVSLAKTLNIIDEKRVLGPFAVFLLLRSITAIFGIASIYVVYILARNIMNEKWSQFTLALYALLPGHWWMSQLIKGEAIVTFFMPLSILSTYLIYKKGHLFWYLFTGAVLGTALATKATFLVTLPAILMIAVVIILKNIKNIKKTFIFAISALFVAFLFFKTLYPYPFCCMATYQKALNDPNNAFQRTSIERYSITPQSIFSIWREYQSKEYPFFTLAFGEPATYIHLAGILMTLILLTIYLLKRDKRSVLLSAILLIYGFFFISLNQYSGVNEDRYIVPFAPYIALFSGMFFYLLDSVSVKARSLTSFRQGLVLMLGVGVLIYTLIFSIEYLKPTIRDPRTDVSRFIDRQTDPKATVFIYIPSSRDKIFTYRDKGLIYTYEEKAEIESGKIVPDYIVIYRTINHNGRWGSFNFTGDITLNPYGNIIPELLKKRYQKIVTFGGRPNVFGAEKPESYNTPTYDIYEKIR